MAKLLKKKNKSYNVLSSISPENYTYYAGELPEVVIAPHTPNVTYSFVREDSKYPGGYGVALEYLLPAYDGYSGDFEPSWGRNIYKTPTSADTIYFYSGDDNITGGEVIRGYHPNQTYAKLMWQRILSKTPMPSSEYPNDQLAYIRAKQEIK